MADTPKKSAGTSSAASRAAEAARALDPAAKVAAAIRTIQTTSGKTASGVRSEARNPLLDALVYGDNDLVGLVAYAMHEVNRRDWCLAYEAAHGRPPSEGEINAYLVGEQLERRLDTYRRLAEDALAKVASGGSDQTMRRLSEGVPEIIIGSHSGSAPVAAPAATGESRPASPVPAPVAALAAAPPLGATLSDKAIVPLVRNGQMTKLLVYLLFLLVAVIGLAVLLKYGMDITQPTK